MSGEHYDNVQFEAIEDAPLPTLWRLAADLSMNDAEDLALALLKIIARRQDLDHRIARLGDDFIGLQAPLKAFNYWLSADTTQETFRAVLEEWRKDR